MRAITAIALSVAAFASAVGEATVPAAAANRWMTIYNQTGYTIDSFYASRRSTDSWEEDILGDRVLRNNGSVDVNINDGTGACVFDFKVVLSNGYRMTHFGVNVCSSATFTWYYR